MALRIAKGMEVAIITVARQEPKKRITTIPVRPAANNISRTTSVIESFTKIEASLSNFTLVPSGLIFSISGMASLTPLTTESVEDSPSFMTTRMTACLPLTKTAFNCGGPAN